jgi:hypothetical protein
MPCLVILQDDATGEVTREYVDHRDVRAKSKEDLKDFAHYRFRWDSSYWWAKEAKTHKRQRLLSRTDSKLCAGCKSPRVCLYAGCKETNG